MTRYRELRGLAHPGDLTVERIDDDTYEGAGWPERGKTEHANCWPSIVELPAPDETVYLTPRRAAEVSGRHPATLAAMRRRGEMRSIGYAPSEYRAARQLAGWTDGGWGPLLHYLREDVERL
jgi:hypothetical protein